MAVLTMLIVWLLAAGLRRLHAPPGLHGAHAAAPEDRRVQEGTGSLRFDSLPHFSKIDRFGSVRFGPRTSKSDPRYEFRPRLGRRWTRWLACGRGFRFHWLRSSITISITITIITIIIIIIVIIVIIMILLLLAGGGQQTSIAAAGIGTATGADVI